MVVISEAVTARSLRRPRRVQSLLMSHTEVVASLVDHLAVHLPKSIANIDDLEGIGDDLILVLGRDILQRRNSQSMRTPSGGAAGQ